MAESVEVSGSGTRTWLSTATTGAAGDSFACSPSSAL